MNNSSLRELIVASSRDILVPVVRLLLKYGISCKEFCDVARRAFVEVATNEFGIRERPANISRVARLTGMTRREVSRQREQFRAHRRLTMEYMSRASRVLSGWHQDPEFVGAHGRPRDLSAEGPGATFSELVRRYGDRLSVSAVLQELESGRAVRQLPNGLLRATRSAFVPQPMEASQILLWASVLRDVGTTLEYNIMREKGKGPRFERRALSLRVDRNALPAFRQLLEIEGQAFLEGIDDWLTAHQAEELPGADAVRLGAGVYHIEDTHSLGQLR